MRHRKTYFAGTHQIIQEVTWGRLLCAGKTPHLILDTAPVSGTLPALVKIAGDPKRAVTISDFAAAKELGVRINIEEGTIMPYDVLGDFAQLAADRKFTVPIACTFPLEDWRAALDLSQSRKARGKLILLPSSAAPFV
jgi:NADPH:quinone reductase-like Zn-dependent oxidoreductase